MGRARHLLFAVVLLPICVHAQETLYVTDKLFLGLYAEPEARGKAMDTLVSGTPLQIIERGKYFIRVRTADGKEGWVKSAYLVEEKPPRLLLDQLHTERDRLTQQLERARAQLTAAQQSATGANAELQKLQAVRSERNAALAQLQSENQSLRQRLSTRQRQVPLWWLIGAAAICLGLGLWGGFAWLDHRIRSRHGGFRIY